MHLEVLDTKQREIFERLGQIYDFYLAGGTALALQIGHRVSVDFDLFQNKKIPVSFLEKVEKTFSGYKIKILVNNADELTLFINDVKVTFLYFPYKPFYPLESTTPIKLLGIKDIAANKAYTIGRRAAYKDYTDLYFILSQGFAGLSEISDIAKQKFDDGFDQRLFLEQLVYLDDVAEETIRFLSRPISKKELSNLFQAEIAKIKLE